MSEEEAAYVAWSVAKAAAETWRTHAAEADRGEACYRALDECWEQREALLRAAASTKGSAVAIDANSSSKPTISAAEWRGCVQQRTEALAQEAGAIAVATVQRDGTGGVTMLGGTSLGPRTTMIAAPSAVLVHVWASRREARRYHEAQRRWSQAAAEVQLPHSVLRVAPCVLLAHAGAMVTVAWLPRAVSEESVPLQSGSVMSALTELCGEHIRAEGAPLMLLCADGSVACVGTPSTFWRVSIGRRVPLRLNAARELSCGFKDTAEAAGEARVAARLERATKLVLSAAAESSPEQLTFEGRSGDALHACGLNVAFLGQLLNSVSGDERAVSAVRGEMMARALKAHLSVTMAAASGDVVEATNDALRQFAAERVGAMDALSKAARAKFGPKDATFAFTKADVKACGAAAVAFVAQRMCLRLSAAGDSVAGLDSTVLEVSGVVSAAAEACTADAPTKFVFEASAAKVAEAVSDMEAGERRVGNCARSLVRLCWSGWARYFAAVTPPPTEPPSEASSAGTGGGAASTPLEALLRAVPGSSGDAVARAMGLCLRRDECGGAASAVDALLQCLQINAESEAHPNRTELPPCDGALAATLCESAWRGTQGVVWLEKAIAYRSLLGPAWYSLKCRDALMLLAIDARYSNVAATCCLGCASPEDDIPSVANAFVEAVSSRSPTQPAHERLWSVAQHLQRCSITTLQSEPGPASEIVVTCVAMFASAYVARFGDPKPPALWHRSTTVEAASKMVVSFAGTDRAKRTDALWGGVGSAMADLMVAMLQCGRLEEALQSMGLWQGVVEREAAAVGADGGGSEEAALAPLERVMAAVTQVRGKLLRWVTRTRVARMARSRDLLQLSDELEATRVRVAVAHVAHEDLLRRGHLYLVETAARADTEAFQIKQRDCIENLSRTEYQQRNIRIVIRRDEIGRWNALRSLEFEYRVTAARETITREQNAERDRLRWMSRSNDRFIRDLRQLRSDEQSARKEIVDAEAHDWPFTLYACSVLASIIINRGDLANSRVPPEYSRDLVRISLLSDAQLPALVKKGALSEAAKKIMWDEDVQRGAITSSESVFRNSMRRGFAENMPARSVPSLPLVATQHGKVKIIAADDDDDRLSKDMKELWQLLKAKAEPLALANSPAPFAQSVNQTHGNQTRGRLPPMPPNAMAAGPSRLPPGPSPSAPPPRRHGVPPKLTPLYSGGGGVDKPSMKPSPARPPPPVRK